MTEKEVLQLKIALLQERMLRLQGEFNITQRDSAVLQDQLAKTIEKEKESMELVGKVNTSNVS